MTDVETRNEMQHYSKKSEN